MLKDVNKQLEILLRGTVDIVTREEFTKNLPDPSKKRNRFG